MILQLIGLPCSGKSTVIKSLKPSCTKIDIRDFYGFRRENKLIKHLNNVYNPQKLYIIESACGIDIANSTIVLLDVSKTMLHKRMEKRKFHLSNKDQSLLKANMVPYQYKVNSFYCSSLIEHLWHQYQDQMNAAKQTKKNRSYSADNN